MKKNGIIITIISTILYSHAAFAPIMFALVAPAPVALAQEAPFSDVQTGNSYFIPIQYLKDQGLIEGYDGGKFKPDQDINRAEALKILQKAIKGPDTHNPTAFSFADVKTEDWFYQPVLQAWNSYIITGYPDKLFHPEKNINIAEGLKMGLLQENKEIPENVDSQPYSDVQIDDWYAKYAVVAKQRKLFLESRNDGSLNASRNLNRGMFAEYIYKLIRSANGSMFGRATWYADFLAKKLTSSGEPYIPDNLTAAHRTLPFGTKLLVTNLSNGKSVKVTVNDRGPYAIGVHLDLSKSAFAELAPTGAGIIVIEYQIINPETQPNKIDPAINQDQNHGF